MNTNIACRICIALLVALVFPALAPAAVHTVRQDGTGDFPTISAALAAAAAGDTIDIGPGTYPESLDVAKRIAFIGSSGAAATILDGNRLHRLMLLRSAASGSSIDGLTLTRGAEDYGAGILVEDSCAVTIRNCAFTGVEVGTCNKGAAIYAVGPSTLMIEDCAFYYNYSLFGASIQLTAGCVLDMARCRFSMNWSGMEAGCIAAHRATLRVLESLFYTNAAEDLAGCILYDDSNGRIARSTFFNNQSSGSSGLGAATIFVLYSPDVTLERNILCFEKNGFALWDQASGCAHSCNLYWNNYAGNVGGDASMDPTEWAADPLFCDPVEFDLSIANESPAAPANNACGALVGALAPACAYEPPGTCVPVRLKVRQDGSGDFPTINAALAAASNCDTIDVGAGTYPELLVVTKGVAFVGSAGAAATIIDGENARQCFVFTLGSTGASVTGFTLTRAYFPNNGAAIRVQDGVHVTVLDCRIADCVSTANGAAFFVRHSGTRLVMEDCTFSGNHSVGGTGVIMEPGTVDLARCVFHDNSADLQGGCVSALSGATANIVECVMYNNTCLDVSGGIYFYGSSGIVRSCTFAGNTSSGDDAATIYTNYCAGVVVEKNIVSFERDGWGLRHYPDYNVHLAHTCNLFWGNSAGDLAGTLPDSTEIFLDPRFCDAASAIFGVSFSSPAAPWNNGCNALIGACPPACDEEIATLLQGFSAERREGGIAVTWELAAGSDAQTFSLSRSTDGGPFEPVAAAVVERTGAASFKYTDRSIQPGRSYAYRISYPGGDRAIVLFETQAIAVPALPLALHQNYPNPFNPTTTLAYYLPEPSAVKLEIFDAAGGRVAVLVDGRQDAGPHAIEWQGIDGRGNPVSSGVYFYRLKAGSTVLTRKMILIR